MPSSANMTKHLLITLFILPLFICSIANGQPLNKPKKIKVRGNYIHEATGTIFPENIGDYRRYEVTRFDKQERNVCAEYKLSGPFGSTKITIYLYPAGYAADTRFSDAYGACLMAAAAATGTGLNATQQNTSFKKDGYKVNGFKAFYVAGGNRNVLELYECGDWFFKIRVTSGLLDSAAIYKLTRLITNMFDPVNMVKKSSLSSKVNMHIAPAAMQDSTLLDCVLVSLFKKLEWIDANVDSLERLAGFPNLYFEAHMLELQTFVKCSDTSRVKIKEYSGQSYAYQLKSLMENGYLDEFIMEQHSMIMIVPENKQFDFDKYYKWKETHPIDIKPYITYYVLAYLTKEEAAKAKDEKQ